METNQAVVEVEELSLGQQLNKAETAVHLSKLAVADAIIAQPVDEVVLAERRANLHESRMAANALRKQLLRSRARPALSGGFVW